jgi:hypothetical protein
LRVEAEELLGLDEKQPRDRSTAPQRRSCSRWKIFRRVSPLFGGGGQACIGGLDRSPPGPSDFEFPPRGRHEVDCIIVRPVMAPFFARLGYESLGAALEFPGVGTIEPMQLRDHSVAVDFSSMPLPPCSSSRKPRAQRRRPLQPPRQDCTKITTSFRAPTLICSCVHYTTCDGQAQLSRLAERLRRRFPRSPRATIGDGMGQNDATIETLPVAIATNPARLAARIPPRDKQFRTDARRGFVTQNNVWEKIAAIGSDHSPQTAQISEWKKIGREAASSMNRTLRPPRPPR